MKFNEKLVLNSYLLSLLGVENFEELTKDLKDSRLEGLDEKNNSLFYNQLISNILVERKISDDKLEEYDGNIVKHTKSLGRDINWKYFQYLSLLFVEIYLDKYFEDKEQLLEELNNYLEKFNENITPKKEKFLKYNKNELNKLALYNATGSGKTLLMHINLLQFKYYARRDKIKINKTILITPNSGLSNQHLEEFKLSNIESEIFSKDSKGLFESNGIEIIETTKLGDEEGDKTVAVDSFEDNNLVFIDEGHRGAKGDVWKTNRDKLCVKGFAFEYSATFAQVVNSATNAKKSKLKNEYSKAIIFDYSYKYFYKDGYGKDYSILNLSDDSFDIKQKYLTASLLSFYQQLKIYHNNRTILKPYLIEKPLMVFVGAKVNAVSNKKGEDGGNIATSDVVDVLLFIDNFIKNKQKSIADIEMVLSHDSGLQNSQGVDIFENKFSFLVSQNLQATAIFDDILKIIFNASSGILHLENLKGVEGEIALKIGENEHFGVINVGDSNKLVKLCEKNRIPVTSNEFSNSLFKNINDTTSNLQILIGSKKFSEGWNSWRVSTMGLINIGKSEGSQIIQLFGRGVRLKGFNFCLQRSRAIKGKELERKYQAIETLNIFGLKANYMNEFKKYLKEEGVPVDERIEFVLPVIYDNKYKEKKLKVLSIKEGNDFKKDFVFDFQMKAGNKSVSLNLYKKIDTLESKNRDGNALTLNNETFQNIHLSFINKDNLFFALQQYKSEKGWSNLNVSKQAIEDFLKDHDWYDLYIPKADMAVVSFKKVSYFETIVITLLKKYMKMVYEYEKSKWENKYLEYRELDKKKDAANLIDNYIITVEDKENELIGRLKSLEAMLKKGAVNDAELTQLSNQGFKAFSFDKHLYKPLLFKDKGLTTLQIKPVHLNEGEAGFVEDLNNHIKNNTDELIDTEIYLLRNQSKTGIGFFVEGNFYPDFIMWVIKNGKQFISFIDPKGIRNLNLENDSKMNLAIKIKEIEKKLGDNDTILNSFILSNTTLKALNKIHSDLTYEFFDDNNVFFQVDDRKSYISKMFGKILK